MGGGGGLWTYGKGEGESDRGGPPTCAKCRGKYWKSITL